MLQNTNTYMYYNWLKLCYCVCRCRDYCWDMYIVFWCCRDLSRYSYVTSIRL